MALKAQGRYRAQHRVRRGEGVLASARIKRYRTPMTGDKEASTICFLIKSIIKSTKVLAKNNVSL